MTLEQGTVFDEYYKGLKANGWSKDAAAKAARRHVNLMSSRQVKAEAKRIITEWARTH